MLQQVLDQYMFVELKIGLGQLYYHGVNAAMIAYDITNKASFENINNWKEKLEEKIEDDKSVIRLLVGCKADLEDKREVGQSSKLKY